MYPADVHTDNKAGQKHGGHAGFIIVHELLLFYLFMILSFSAQWNNKNFVANKLLNMLMKRSSPSQRIVMTHGCYN